jgi:23S rRNA (cytidine1920-2'-O)/16S rRNA (cytidine1409-2'-O)-methyltransferase
MLTTDSADFVLLVKPQFEAGRARVGKGGIVRDPVVHAAVLRDVVSGLDGSGIGVHALAVSPLKGADGNVEFFAHARRSRAAVDADDIERVVSAAHGADA